MTKYVLLVNLASINQKLCEEISVTISPIVDSKNLKYYYKDSLIVFHFESNVFKSEIMEFLRIVFYGVTDFFVLTEFHDTMTLNLPKDILEHIGELNCNSDGTGMEIDVEKTINNLEFLEWIESDEYEDNIEEFFLIKRPSLDQILDKISEKGYHNLTQFEKDTLDCYSK